VDEAANDAVFEFPYSIRLYLLPVAVACCVMILIAILEPSVNHLALAALVTLIGTVQFISFSRLRYRVAVSNDGIRYMPYAAAPIFFQWSEVASLELREGIGAARYS